MNGRPPLEPTTFLFPGQGSQYPGMARELAGLGTAARDHLPEAEEVTGLPLRELMTRGDAASTAAPRVAQLLVFVLSCALLAELRERGREPQAVAGHSLGEYTALVASGMLDWHRALDLVAARSRAMAEAAEVLPGTMAAIVGLPLEAVEELCRRASLQGTVIVVANRNSARQTVVSGEARAVTEVANTAKAAGALRARVLPVGGAYHSPLMGPAEEGMRPLLTAVTLRPPNIPIVSSITGHFIGDVEAYRARLLGQVTAAVRWHDAVNCLRAHGARAFVEVGPGRVLSGLTRASVGAGRFHEAWKVLRVSGAERPLAPAGTRGAV